MSASPAISVLIDTYQQGRFVARAVRSVLAQTHTPQEIVVVDDGSTDDTAEVLTEFGDRVRVIKQANQGQAGALNAGIATLQGNWVAFLDGDDTWGPRHLVLVVAAAAGPECDAVLAPLERVDADDLTIGVEPPARSIVAISQTLQNPSMVLDGMLPWLAPTSGIACRVELLRAMGPIPAEYRIAADGWIQVALQVAARRMALLPERTVRLRVHGANRWTGRDELDTALLSQRRALYEKLAAAARGLAAAHGRDAAGLSHALEAQAAEFAIWERIVAGERGAALALAWRWSPSTTVVSPLHRGFRRAHLVLATLSPTPVYLGLRNAWRSMKSAMSGRT